MTLPHHPFVLSPSKGCTSLSPVSEEGQGFDKLSLNGGR